MFGILKLKNRQRGLCRMISPYIEYTENRHGRIASEFWSDPFVLGFFTIAISSLAPDDLNSNDHARLQAGCISDLSQVDHLLVGQWITLLSMSEDNDFMTGCVQGNAFAEALRLTPDDVLVDVEMLPVLDDVALSIWEASVETRLA